MASKRKRDADDALVSPNAKQIKTEEVTRSGRVRKKPAKFADNVDDDNDIKPDVDKLQVTPPVDIPSHGSSATPPTKQVTMTSPVIIKREPDSDGKVRKKSGRKIDDVPDDVVKAEPVEYYAPVDVSHVPSVIATSAKQLTMTSPVFVNSAIETELEEDEMEKTPSRSGRARKKSAKVLEMEEFEEAEKKQTVKKDSGKKGKTAQSVTIAQPGIQPVAMTTPAIPILKIKDIPTMPKVEPGTPTALQVQASPQKSPALTAKSPVIVSKSPDNKGSVIKLLLSSPSQAANRAIATTSVSPTSTDTSLSSSGKKTKGKGKSQAAQSVDQKGSKIRQALQSLPVGGIQPAMVQVKQESGAVGQADLHIKTEPGLDNVPVTPKETKAKKGGKKSSPVLKDESPFLPPPVPSPNVIHVGPVNTGLEIRQVSESATSKKGKKDKVKSEQGRLDMEEAMMHEEYGLGMPEIELETGEDFMEMDDEDSLMISEEEVETEKSKGGKSGKKKASKGKGKAQATGDSANSDERVLVMDFARMKSDEKKKKKDKVGKEESAGAISKKKRPPTAYMLWCNATRPQIVREKPWIVTDFSAVSKMLGEMWSNLSEKDKLTWKRRAKKASGKGSTLITTGKASTSKITPQMRQSAAPAKSNQALAQALMSAKSLKPTADDLNTPMKGFGMEPVDVAAHLKIVGESLSIIGLKLQEHRGLIAVQGSLSVLLDSMLCALAPLLCLTAVLPETNGLPAETHLKNLDNIAYIMPGL